MFSSSVSVAVQVGLPLNLPFPAIYHLFFSNPVKTSDESKDTIIYRKQVIVSLKGSATIDTDEFYQCFQ